MISNLRCFGRFATRNSFQRVAVKNTRSFHNGRRLFAQGQESSPVEQAGASPFSSRAFIVFAVAGAGIASMIYFTRESEQKIENTPARTNLGLGSTEERVKILEAEVARLSIAEKNQAFVFIKSHAVTPAVEELVKEKFADNNIKILQSGEIDGEEIDRELLIDTHYGAIASKAVKLNPSELNLTEGAKADFKKMSGMSWEDAVAAGKVKNAKQFCEAKNIDGEQLDELWSKLKRGQEMVKFGGGFYCGKLSESEYVINGFYMAMRGKFTKPGTCIKYFLVEFKPSLLSWADFRGKVLGGTDPAGAEKGSLRREIYDHWKKLGLETKPNTGDNGVHASASPFEAFAERCNWLKSEFNIETDRFGKALLANGVLKPTIMDYMEDATVEYKGKKQSVFDLLEDLDSEDCLDKALDIAEAKLRL